MSHGRCCPRCSGTGRRCPRVCGADTRVPTACRALVDELEWEIAQVDPRKTIQMGSFRINPDGSQSVVEVRVSIQVSVGVLESFPAP